MDEYDISKKIFVIMIGQNRKCRDVIDEIYIKNEKHYYELYSNSSFKNDTMKTHFSLLEERTIIRLAGILESCCDSKNYFLIEKIINSLNPALVKFAKKEATIDAVKFYNQYILQHALTLSELEITAYLSALEYLAQIKKKPFRCNTGISDFYTGVWKRLLYSTEKYNHRFNILSDMDIKTDKLYTLLFMNPKEDIKEMSVDVLIENLFDYNLLSRGIDPHKNPTKYEQERYKLHSKSFYGYISSIKSLVETLGYNDHILDGAIINNNAFKMLMRDCASAIDCKLISENEAASYIIVSLYLYAFTQLYTEAKDLHLNRAEESKMESLKEFEKNLLEKETTIIKTKEICNKNLLEKDLLIKSLKEEIKSLKSDNKELANKLKKSEQEHNKEIEWLNNLRKEAIQRKMEAIEEISSISLEEAIDYLNNKSIAIFGGAKSISNIKEVLPNVVLYNEINKDISSIKSADKIFLNSEFFNHAFTEKLNSYTNKYNKKYDYIGGTNIKRIILTMYNSFEH